MLAIYIFLGFIIEWNEESGMKTPCIASRATVPTTKIMTVIKSKHVDLGFTCEIQDAIEDTQRNYLLKLSTRSRATLVAISIPVFM